MKDISLNFDHRYQSRTSNTTKVILELIELAKAMNKAQSEEEVLSFGTAELAFYEALGTNDAAVMMLGDETFKQTSRELTESIRKNATINRNKRSVVQAKMRVMLRRLLRKHHYPPDKEEAAVETIIRKQNCCAWMRSLSREKLKFIDRRKV